MDPFLIVLLCVGLPLTSGLIGLFSCSLLRMAKIGDMFDETGE